MKVLLTQAEFDDLRRATLAQSGGCSAPSQAAQSSARSAASSSTSTAVAAETKQAPESEFQLPKGYKVAPNPPTAESLEFQNAASPHPSADALVGEHIMFKWCGIGWIHGVIQSRNKDGRRKIEGKNVNFNVFYFLGEDDAFHSLGLEEYIHADKDPATASPSSWMLLAQVPQDS